MNGQNNNTFNGYVVKTNVSNTLIPLHQQYHIHETLNYT